MNGPNIFEEKIDPWPQDRPVVRVNWLRMGLALLLPALLVALSDHRINIQVVEGGPSAPAKAASAPNAGSLSSTLQLVGGPVSQGTDSRSPLVPLGISVHGPRELASTASVEIIGLPRGWVLSAGRPLGDRWRIPVAQLSGVVVLPPQGFSGAADIAVELRLADDTLVERRSVRLAMVTDAPEHPTEKRMAPELATDKGILFLNKGEDLLIQRDFSAARLVLRRLAEDGNAHAALLLGETYEGCLHYPLQCSADANPATARSWYEKAAKLGSAEARRRLDRLASEEPGSQQPLVEHSSIPAH